MTVLWSNRALRSLADIHHHISTDSKEAANRITLKRGDQLASFPWWPGIIDQAFEN